METEALTVAYARVKAILDEAAGDSTADYGGAGRFWDNGAQALEVAEIFGIKMVAPPPEGHACCIPPHARSDTSGLIKGLRGEAPFDGGRFPALPWGGHAVAPADIDRIADWIDAGCPDDATGVAVELAPGKPAKTATVKVADGHPRFVLDRNRLTGGGISAGLDEALMLITLLGGTELAREVQQNTQYYPDPPVRSAIPPTPKCPLVGIKPFDN